jgi:PPK2 family polyphosphate:nucleotide phosphotransferase
MTIDISRFLAREGRSVNLKKWPTRVDAFYDSKQEYETLLAQYVHRLRERQSLLYADDRYSLLLIFQAMDAAGKDGMIKHVMSGVNPQGCQVFSFKHPSAEDLDHDFLWRPARCLPERGRIGVFNRSYYEEVLIVRVHPEILKAQRLPDVAPSGKGSDDKIWKRRYQSMTGFESHLHLNGTRVLKFFLHLSKDEQRKRLLARIDDPTKQWKFSEGDLAERDRWKDYMRAYEDCIAATSTARAPWYIVPADDKQNARLIVSQAIIEALDGLRMQYPKTDPARAKALQAIRKRLLAD